MDGSEAKRLFEELMNQIKRLYEKYIERYVQKAAATVAKATGRGTIKLYGRTRDYLEQYNTDKTIKKVLNDGQDKILMQLGEFDRDETAKIIADAKSKGIPIAVTEKPVESVNLITARQLSAKEAEELIRYEKEIQVLETKINTLYTSNETQDKIRKKVKPLERQLEDKKRYMANITKGQERFTYTIMVNRSQESFLSHVKMNYLDHDQKQLENFLNEEKNSLVKLGLNEKNMGDVHALYESVKLKYSEVEVELKELQNEYDEFIHTQKDVSHFETLKTEKENQIKNVQVQLEDLAHLKEQTQLLSQQKTFSGSFDKESISKAKGNVSLSLDYFDVISSKNNPEGYAEITMTSEEYSEFAMKHDGVKDDIQYAAFKEKEDGVVSVITPIRYTQKLQDYTSESTHTLKHVNIHTRRNVGIEDQNKTISIYKMDVPKTKQGEPLNFQNFIDDMVRTHQVRNERFTITECYDRGDSFSISIQSTIPEQANLTNFKTDGKSREEIEEMKRIKAIQKDMKRIQEEKEYAKEANKIVYVQNAKTGDVEQIIEQGGNPEFTNLDDHISIDSVEHSTEIVDDIIGDKE